MIITQIAVVLVGAACVFNGAAILFAFRRLTKLEIETYIYLDRRVGVLELKAAKS